MNPPTRYYNNKRNAIPTLIPEYIGSRRCDGVSKAMQAIATPFRGRNPRLVPIFWQLSNAVIEYWETGALPASTSHILWVALGCCTLEHRVQLQLLSTIEE